MSGTYDLRGHTALVTGAGRRLGRGLAEALAAHGANLAVHHQASSEGAEEVAAAARRAGMRAIAIQADLGDAGQAAGLIDRATQGLGPIDLLVNSAAIFEPIGPLETDRDAWDRHLAVNLTAPFLLAQAFARRLAGGAGAIVNILDWRALRPGADHFPYTVTKAALAAMTRSLAVAFAPSIRVNGLALGAILPAADRPDQAAPPPGAPIARWGTLEEVTQSVLFLLAGPDFITGEILHLDGGRHLL